VQINAVGTSLNTVDHVE